MMQGYNDTIKYGVYFDLRIKKTSFLIFQLTSLILITDKYYLMSFLLNKILFIFSFKTNLPHPNLYKPQSLQEKHIYIQHKLIIKFNQF